MTAYRDRLEAGEYASGAPTATQAPSNGEPDLDQLTKAELLDLAQARGVSPANNDMTKAELKAALEKAG